MRCSGPASSKAMAWVPSESAVEELMPRLLPVEPCDLAEGFDPSVPPRTPQEYLRRVQIEAAQCPDVVVAQIDPKKLKRKQSVNVSLSGCQPAPEGYSPTLKWQQQQVAQFSTVRQPKSEDEEGWKKFCLGERLCAEGAIGPATNESPGIDYVQIGFPPLLSIVSRMNQATVTSVLEYLSNWFGERDFTPELVVLHLFYFIMQARLYIFIIRCHSIVFIFKCVCVYMYIHTHTYIQKCACL
ncbi:gem-associated protein 2 isoform X2 [Marmota marmota marmota]|uniref:gem-associated protein 2 isoform X2 n=1 Tax=Marmota marmota marmota TaxID=9994 RepID=UPI0020925847|nr:gem-associated protein 2 isoform X2 [Marmota marmota marmota]